MPRMQVDMKCLVCNGTGRMLDPWGKCLVCGGSGRFVWPPGYVEPEKWCPKCEQFKKLSKFHLETASKDGRQRICKVCRKEYDGEMYKKPKKRKGARLRQGEPAVENRE